MSSIPTTTTTTTTRLKKNPLESADINNSLSLIPRVKLLLTVYRSDLSVSPIDEWQIKRSLLDYIKTTLPHINIPDDSDLHLHKFKDMKKRKRQDPIASGALYVRDLNFLTTNRFHKQEQDNNLELKLLEWRQSFVRKLDGIELSIRGVKFKLNACVPEYDDFEGLEKSWEEFYAFNSRGYKQKPDTIILKGLPSRWFAETRVSSTKPSMLVTHEIFSKFGTIRKFHVASDDGLGENAQEGGDELKSGLQCKVVVQFEKHDDFYRTLKVLCGRSMQKHGSRLRADYEATWDRNDFFGNTLQRTTGNTSPNKSHLSTTTRQHQNETPRLQLHTGRFDSNDSVSSKRFKE